MGRRCGARAGEGPQSRRIVREGRMALGTLLALAAATPKGGAEGEPRQRGVR
jgi:hypothetical protein